MTITSYCLAHGLPDHDCAADPTTPTTEAGRTLAADVRELAEAFHQVGSLRDHADPNDMTGWNVHGIETCEDVYCMDALAAGSAILAIEAQARADERRRLAGLVEALPGIVLSSSSGTDGHLSWGIYRAAVLALLSDTEPAP